jgi:hypothetical protein
LKYGCKSTGVNFADLRLLPLLSWLAAADWLAGACETKDSVGIPEPMSPRKRLLVRFFIGKMFCRRVQYTASATWLASITRDELAVDGLIR